jgi:hypothetical protein
MDHQQSHVMHQSSCKSGFQMTKKGIFSCSINKRTMDCGCNQNHFHWSTIADVGECIDYLIESRHRLYKEIFQQILLLCRVESSKVCAWETSSFFLPEPKICPLSVDLASLSPLLYIWSGHYARRDGGWGLFDRQKGCVGKGCFRVVGAVFVDFFHFLLFFVTFFTACNFYKLFFLLKQG